MTETAVATITVTDDELDLIKRTIARDATDQELKLFLYDCRRRGVHPLDKMLHFTKRQGKYTPVTSIDLMRAQAADTGEMAGSDDPTFDRDDEGLCARVTVYRLTNGQRFPYTATARWNEYFPGDGPQGFMWRKMPRTMLGKCAEALALRKAFPKQLQGLYAAEEMHQASAEERAARRTVEVAPAPALDAQANGGDDAAGLFPKPEDEDRRALAVDAQRLAKKLKLGEEDRNIYRKTYLNGADLLDPNLDIAALTDLVNALRARAGEKKWGVA